MGFNLIKMEIPENVVCPLSRMLLFATLTTLSLLFASSTSYAYGKDECGDYWSGMSAKEKLKHLKCLDRQEQVERKLKQKKQAEFDKLDHRISMFEGVDISPLTADQMKLPQARNKGSLMVKFELITDSGEKVYRGKVCTSFTTGVFNFRADRHCLIYEQKDLEMDPDLNITSVQAIGAQSTFNKEIISPYVFDIDLKTVKYNDPIKYPYSESASFEIKEKVNGQYLGELLGYPAMSVDGQFIEGIIGSLPYPKDVENPCNAVYFNPDERDDVLNRVLKYADSKNQRLLREKPKYRGKVTLNVGYIQPSLVGDKNHKICGMGFTDHKNFELSVVNCYAAGLAHNQLATNCSQTPGMSGGDNYYINGLKHISVVVAQINNRTNPTTPEEEGVYGPQANLATLLNAHAMTVRYDSDTKKVVKTVLSPITGEQLADKKRQAAAK